MELMRAFITNEEKFIYLNTSLQKNIIKKTRI